MESRNPLRTAIFSLVAILLWGFLPGCVKEPGPGEDPGEDNPNIDGISMATPDGGELPRAEEGPVRSALGEPEVNLETFQLSVTGLVDSAFTLSWEEIQNFPVTSTDTMIMYCVEGWEVWGVWKGMLVQDLLDKAHLQSDAQHVKLVGRDGYTTSLPISYLIKYNAILAYEVNLAPLQKQDGFPLRLIAFGKYGYKWAKWVTKLEVIHKSQLGFWEKYGYSDQGDVILERRRHYEGADVKPLEY